MAGAQAAGSVLASVSRRATEPGPRRLGTAAVALAVIFAAPSLGKAGDFNDYYLATAFPWLAVVLALCWRAVASAHRSQALVAVVLAVILLPLGALRGVRATGPEAPPFAAAYNQVEDWARALARAVTDSPEAPCALVVSVSCPSPVETARSRDLLRFFLQVSEQGAAVRWFSGRPGLPVEATVGGATSRTCRPLLVVRWCGGRPQGSHVIHERAGVKILTPAQSPK